MDNEFTESLGILLVTINSVHNSHPRAVVHGGNVSATARVLESDTEATQEVCQNEDREWWGNSTQNITCRLDQGALCVSVQWGRLAISLRTYNHDLCESSY